MKNKILAALIVSLIPGFLLLMFMFPELVLAVVIVDVIGVIGYLIFGLYEIVLSALENK